VAFDNQLSEPKELTFGELTNRSEDFSRRARAVPRLTAGFQVVREFMPAHGPYVAARIPLHRLSQLSVPTSMRAAFEKSRRRIAAACFVQAGPQILARKKKWPVFVRISSTIGKKVAVICPQSIGACQADFFQKVSVWNSSGGVNRAAGLVPKR